MIHFGRRLFSFRFIQKNQQKSAPGFTLVEILVVLLIISIVSGAILINISPNRSRQLEGFSKDLRELIVYAEEQALLRPDVLKLSFDADSFTFLRYQAATGQDDKSSWVATHGRILGRHPVPDFIEVSIKMRDAAADESYENQPEIIISSNGDVTPFTIYIGMRGEKPRYAMIGEADGSITNKLLQ